MKVARTIVAPSLLILLLLSGGCGKSELVNKAEELKEKMCACTDLECAAGVQEEIATFDRENQGQKVTKGDNDAISSAMKEAGECLMKANVPATAGGAEEAAPAAEEAAPAAEEAAPAEIGRAHV